MKAQIANVTKIASIHRPNLVASLAALLLLLCLATGAWAQTPPPTLRAAGPTSPCS